MILLSEYRACVPTFVFCVKASSDNCVYRNIVEIYDSIVVETRPFLNKIKGYEKVFEFFAILSSILLVKREIFCYNN